MGVQRRIVRKIQGGPVEPLFAARGSIHSVLIGEAPGPCGADQSRIPFWGDGAGRPLYRALAQAGCAEIPDAAWEDWDGASLRERGLSPRVRGVALTNAWPRCPTEDGVHFRAPKKAELLSPENLDRLRTELTRALRRAEGVLRVITLGAHARALLGPRLPEWFGDRAELLPVPHPSAQGLLSSVEGSAKGMKMIDLEAAWRERLATLLTI